MTRPVTRHFNQRAAANLDRLRISNLERRIGSDLLGYPWAVYGLGGLGLLATGATAFTDAAGIFWTETPDIFDVGPHTYTGSGAATKDGPIINAEGLFRWTISLATDPSRSGPCLVSFDRLDFGFSHVSGSPNRMEDGVVWFSILTGNDGSGTGVAQIFSVFNNTGSNFSPDGIAGTCLIEQISTFVPGGGYSDF